jgi:peroxiredoxin
MKTKFLALFVFLFFTLLAQAQNERGFFEVTFDEFSPPTQDLIMSFEGKEPMAFLANDIKGDEYYLKNYKGKVVFVYFWKGDCSTCLSQVASLNLLNSEEKDRLQIISFADEAKAEAALLAEQNGIEFPVLTNGKLLGEAAYGIELGYPRLFAIDAEGKVTTVIPQAALDGKSDIYLQLKDLLDKVANR